MRTVDGILAEIRKYKPCSHAQLYRYLAAFNIEPQGVRQRPQLYPDDTAKRILTNLGFDTQSEPAKPGRLLGMGQLRAERARSRRK